jgi:DNA-directed RNA polymerase specialized sigma24 family protein
MRPRTWPRTPSSSAYRALPNFRGDSAFYTWLYKIAVNTAKNFLVSQSRRPPLDDILMDDAVHHEATCADARARHPGERIPARGSGTHGDRARSKPAGRDPHGADAAREWTA